jgi:hypothetical protein
MHAFRRRSRAFATRRRNRRLPAALAALAVLGSAAPSQAERSAGLFVYDVVLVRPLSAVHLLAGAVMFVPAVVLSIPGRFSIRTVRSPC